MDIFLMLPRTFNTLVEVYFTQHHRITGWPKWGSCGSSSASQQQPQQSRSIERKHSWEQDMLFPWKLHAPRDSKEVRAGFPAPLKTPMNSPFREIPCKALWVEDSPRLVSVCPQTHSNTNKLAHKVPFRTSRQVWVWGGKNAAQCFPPLHLMFLD